MEAMACKASTAVSSVAASASRLITCESSRSQSMGGALSKQLRAVVLSRGIAKHNDQVKTFVVSAMADAQKEALKESQKQALQSLSSVVSDDAVPEGHKGLHGFLYGEGGAEVHGSDSGTEFRGREGEDDGNAIVSFEAYIPPRESVKFAGVFAIYNSEEALQYISYTRNVVSTLKSLRARVGQEKCWGVRVKMYTEAALITRAKLEEEKQRWLDSVGPAPGNSEERGLWEGVGNAVALMSEQEKVEYEEKKLKMRKAMGENLFDDVEGEEEDARTRRLKLLQAVEGDDWSSVIDGQTKQTVDPRGANGGALKAEDIPADVLTETGASEQIVSPFASNSQAGGGLYSADTYEFTVENVDKVLDEVRPYLIADGGNVEVVGVNDGVVSLRLQGACGTCPSSTSTMKMGIERVLMEKFGDRLKEVVQVEKQQIGASIPAVDSHLEMLRPAIRNYGGSVEVVSVDTVTGECKVKFHGPAPIGMGIQAAIKDKFPDIKQVRAKPQRQKEESDEDLFYPEAEEIDREALQSFLDLELQTDHDLDDARHYEIMFLVPEKEVEKVPDVIKKVEAFVMEQKGLIWRVNDWGVRRLAYKIKKHERANYVLMNIEMNAAAINQLNTMFERDELVIRHMCISQKEAHAEDTVPPPNYYPESAEELEEENFDLEVDEKVEVV